MGPSKTNRRRKRLFLPVTSFSGLQQGAVTPTLTGTALTDLDLNLTDLDAAAATGTALYLAQERGKSQEGMLWSEMANAATVYIEDATNAVRFPVIHKAVDELILNVEHDASANTNGTAVYVVPTGQRTPWGAAIAILMSVNANNADAVFQDAGDVDSFTVYDFDGAATAGPYGLDWSAAVYIDEDASPATSRLLATNPTGNAEDMYVKGIGGHWLKITHHADPGTPGVALYFDDNAATAHDRLLFISPTTTTMADGEIGHHLGLWSVEGWWVGLLYFDEDAANEYGRLLCNIPAAENGIVYAIEALRTLEITYNADPGTPGVQVYIDDDEGDLDDRLLFVSPTDASGTCQLSPRYKVLGDIAAGVISTIAADTLLQSAGTGTPLLEEINSLGQMGLLLDAAGDDVRHHMAIPGDLDRMHPVFLRAVWTTAAAAVGDRDITFKILYGCYEAGTDQLAAPATALDTAIVADVPTGTAYTVEKTAAGVINAGQLSGDTIGLLTEMDAFDAALTEDKFLLGIEMEYTPQQANRASPRRRAEAHV